MERNHDFGKGSLQQFCDHPSLGINTLQPRNVNSLQSVCLVECGHISIMMTASGKSGLA